MKALPRGILWKSLLGLCLAVAAYLWATSIMDAMFAYRSPLREQAPAPLEAAAPAITRRVVFVLIDGLRLDTAMNERVMPTLASLREQGAWAESRSKPPSYSQTGYSMLLTGAWPEVSDGPAMNVPDEDIPTLTQDDLVSAVHRAGGKTAISAYFWFEKLVPQGAVSQSFYTAGDDRLADEDVMRAALPWLDDPSIQLVLIHLDQVDYAGHHEGGALDPRWDEAAARCDEMLAQILAKLDLAQDTIFVTSDHGHIDQGGHGGQDSVALQELFVLAGAGVKPGHYEETKMVDIAPTLAAMLGAGIPASTQGEVRLDMLAFEADEADALQVRWREQQQRLLTAYAGAIGEKAPEMASDQSTFAAAWDKMVNRRVLRESLLRGAIVLVALAGVGLWLRVLSPERWKWMALAAGVYLMVFHLKYALLDGRTYSLSSVYDVNALLILLAINTFLGLLAGWAVGFFGAKGHQLARCAAANASADILLGILIALGLMVGWNFILNGMWATWTLPRSFLAQFMGFMALFQGLVVSVLLPVFAGVGALLGKRS